MKETIALSNLNERELLRSLAINNIGSFNIRFFNAYNLAKEALLRNGIIIQEEVISPLKQQCLIYSFISDIEYFKNNTFEDCINIVNAINYARKLCRNNEEEKIEEALNTGEFENKNNGLLEVYKKYKQYLKENNLLDSIEVINKAINNKIKIEANFIIFKEDNLEPLEEELLKIITNSYKTVSINEIANKKEIEKPKITYANCYGSVNEVEYILAYIAKNNIKYDDCVISLIDNSYINSFINYKDAYSLPITFGIGNDLSNTNAFKVLTLIHRWNTNFNSLDSLKELLFAPEFDHDKFFKDIDLKQIEKAIDVVGNLRISTIKENTLDEYKNSLKSKKEIDNYQTVEYIANELYKGYIYLIKTYTKTNNKDIEENAIKKICEYLKEYLKVNNTELEPVINQLNKTKINKELSKPGHIHITDLKGALSTIRKHLFICGLNAKTFPGSPSEDYLLLDSDLERFNEPNVKNSINKINLNKELINNVINNANSFNEEIHLSYSGYNLCDLKQENPSSLLFEIYNKQHENNASTKEFEEELGKQHKYFDEDISSLTNLGRKYIEGNVVEEEENSTEENSTVSMDYPISPSTAETFFKCPKRFYLKQILRIEEPEEDDPFNELPANDEGTLIHECMQEYGNNPSMTLEEFMKNAESKIDKYFKYRNTIHKNKLPALKQEFLNVAKTGYERNPGNIVISSEEKLGPYKNHDTGLSFEGRVDRIEKLENGNYQIVDYKTGRKIQHENDDIDTCFQAVLYAYLLEETQGKKVENCQYRYLRNVENINCVYNQKTKESLQNKLNQIKEAFDKNNFPCTEEIENCKYCKLASICGKGDSNE